ncbi:hypothetical protein EW145_g7711 [Phellinidium pouzarii]|uniref:Uncharacterized protein n=1 Tax=Phellinidium pouzarii TaxID=167371 RepID=A0A4S4KFG2_9AGAM|nr:hypothetical protein EW145_g7711 [Phellinidium pouzarii]
MNNFRRSVQEVVQVVKIADTTLKKRLNEFKKTPSGALTLADFRTGKERETKEKEGEASGGSEEDEEELGEDNEGVTRKRGKKMKKKKKERKRKRVIECDVCDQTCARPNAAGSAGIGRGGTLEGTTDCTTENLKLPCDSLCLHPPYWHHSSAWPSRLLPLTWGSALVLGDWAATLLDRSTARRSISRSALPNKSDYVCKATDKTGCSLGDASKIASLVVSDLSVNEQIAGSASVAIVNFTCPLSGSTSCSLTFVPDADNIAGASEYGLVVLTQ